MKRPARETREQELLDTVVERLLRSRLEEETEQTARGLGFGDAWAREVATFAELEALIRFLTEAGASFWNDDSAETCWADELARAVEPHVSQVEEDNHDAIEGLIGNFWRVALMGCPRSRVENPTFLRGFVRGALRVYLKARPRIERFGAKIKSVDPRLVEKVTDQDGGA
jgi:hypothetical protein